jgi:ribonuclease P protein component
VNASPTQSFPKAARLLRRADFLRVYDKGRRQFGPHMTFFYLDRSPDAAAESSVKNAGPRIGLTVSRALGGSVQRNRIRRRVREAVRMNLKDLKRGADIVINPKKSVLKADFNVLVAEVAKGFAVIEGSKSERGGK